MFVIKFILFIFYISVSQSRVPDKVYCVNNECSEPISKAKTLIGYNTADPDLISYPGNADVLIFMKSAGTNADLWYATINGKSGFVNSKFLREYKILQKNLQLIVPFDKSLKESIVQPDKVQQAHVVIDGTTIYTTEPVVHESTTEPAVHESTTEIPITPSTENYVPSLNNEIPVNQNENVNILNPYNEEQKLLDKSVDEESLNTPILETNNKVMTPEPEEILPHENNHSDSETHKSNSKNTDFINKETNNNPEQPANDVLNIKTQNILENYDQPQNDTADIQPLEQNEVTVSVENPSTEDKIQKSENVIAENKQSVDEDQFNNNEKNILPDNSELPNEKIGTEQVVSNSEPNIIETISVSETIENIEPFLTEQLNEIEKNLLKTNIVNGVENIQSIEANTEVVPDNKDISQPLIHEKPVIQDNLIQDNDITSFNTERQQQAPISDSVYTNYPENTVENFNTNIQINNEALDTSKTLPAIFNTESPTIQPAYNPDNPVPTDNANEKSAEISQEQVIDEITDNQELYNIEDSSNNIYSSTESTPIEDSYTLTTPEPSYEANDVTEVPEPQDKNTDGILSSIYTTISDIWPPTTESPKSIYNSEDFPPYENTKADGEESFSFMKYIISVYSSVMGTDDKTKEALFASAGETCFTNEYCDGTSNERNNRLLTFLLTTASSVLLFTLGYYYIDIRRQDGRLIGTINSLQRDLLFTTKECEILKEELATTKNKLAGIEDNSFGMDDMVQSLKEEINELKAQNERLRNSLDANEKLLRVSENTSGELQNTLSDVENTLSELFAERANSEEQIIELNEKVQAFEEELISVSRERDNFQLKYVSAETSLEEARKQTKQLDEINKQLAEAKNTIELQKHEITALKDALKDLKSDSSNNIDVTSLIDHTEIKAKLAKALEERNNYASKYEVEHKERLRLTEEQKTTKETLRTSTQQAAEATTRLEVLGKYFQERESELMKELNSKETLWLSKQGESASTIDKIELLQQEVQRYKEKCDALTLELAEQESTRRTAAGEMEARAHAAWLEARTARREADAARDEAATLRRKLASLSTADGAISPHHKVSSPLDNENPVIPPPLPPLAFLPPPLLPPLPRPPPLGRLPSPHPPRYNDRRYSPDSRYSPESRYSPGSRYSPETVRYSPDSRYSPRPRRTSYSPRSRRRSRERYQEGRGSRSRNLPPDTETEYQSDSPSRDPRRRNRYSRHSGPSSGSGCSSESDK